MLLSINRFVNARRLAKHGAVGVLIESSRLSWCHIVSSGESEQVLSFDNSVYSNISELDGLLDKALNYAKIHRALVGVFLAYPLCVYHSIPCEDLPKNSRDKKQFLQWRLRHLFGADYLQGKWISEFFLGKCGDKNIANVYLIDHDIAALPSLRWHESLLFVQSFALAPLMGEAHSPHGPRIRLLFLDTYWSLSCEHNKTLRFCQFQLWSEAYLAEALASIKNYYEMAAEYFDIAESEPVLLHVDAAASAYITDLMQLFPRASIVGLADAGIEHSSHSDGYAACIAALATVREGCLARTYA